MCLKLPDSATAWYSITKVAEDFGQTAVLDGSRDGKALNIRFSGCTIS